MKIAKTAWLEGLVSRDLCYEVLFMLNRYYSDAVLGCLQRAMAIRTWSKIKEGEDLSLEDALAAFDLFILHDDKGDFAEVSNIFA